MSPRTKTMRSVPLAIALIYALNLLLVAAAYLDFPHALARLIGITNGQTIDSLDDIFLQSFVGVVFGEIGCFALWFNLSTRALIIRFLLFTLGIAQLALLLMFVLPGADFSQFIVFLMASFGLLVLTSLSLRLSSARIHLVKATSETRKHSNRGASIAQILFGTSIVAIFLAVVAAGQANWHSSTFENILHAIGIACALGIIPTASLLIATSLRLWAQILVCIFLALLLSAMVEESARRDWRQLLEGSTIFIWTFSLQILWIRMLPRFGYVIEHVDRKPKTNTPHLFSDVDAPSIDNLS